MRGIPNVISSTLRDGEFFYITKGKDQYRLWSLEKNGSLLLRSSEQPFLSAKKIADHSFIIYEKQQSEFKIFYHNTDNNITKEFKYDNGKGIKSVVLTPAIIDSQNIFLNINFLAIQKIKMP